MITGEAFFEDKDTSILESTNSIDTDTQAQTDTHTHTG